MDAYEATKVVLERIRKLDPENASKIMGLLLIQGHGEKELIRLAFGPEALIQSVILKARKQLGLVANSPPSPSTPLPMSPFSSHIPPFSRQNSTSSTSSRFHGGVGPSSPLSIPNQFPSFSDYHNKEELISPSASALSYAAVVNKGVSNLAVGSSASTMNSSAAPFYASAEINPFDEFQLQDQFSFLNDGSPTLGPSQDMFYPRQDLASSTNGASGEFMLSSSYGGAASNWGGLVDGLQHRRSCSASDICFSSDDPSGGLGWKPCLYFSKGYCKNGTSCRFSHVGHGEAGLVGADSAAIVGSPSKFEMMGSQEFWRAKAVQQQQTLAAASSLMASTSFPYSSVAADKSMNFLLQQLQLQAVSPRTLMMGDELPKFSHNCFDGSDFGLNGGPGMVNACSRQIYLTFPADSTFKEEDVSNYFSMYGPVQDVRIPYQQKRMFGFVTFVYPETVNIILAKGNPHFVCDARVLVKPYKEKGKVPDKHRKHQQQFMESGELAAFGSPTGLESREPYDLPLGARMFYNAQDMLWRRKMEERADLQHALELQKRRLMSLQLLDVKKNNHHHTRSTGALVSSPLHSPNFINRNASFSVKCSSPEKSENAITSVVTDSANNSKDMQQIVNPTENEKDSSTDKLENRSGKGGPGGEETDSSESLEPNLPYSPFASPKAAGENITAFANNLGEEKVASVSAPLSINNLISSSLFPATTSLDIAPLKSCHLQVPRLSPGQGTVGM